ncbi:c-type cytochrome [Vibrio vulnificus]|uniref:c-type cytochrome n=1 Tax=Vibrio vulnificus TaxID=672 RepID=UPI001EEBC749|nr:c-type cytochrome [Vibrio vulnificus]MCG6287583.1 cytochrome c [Vibrio vulnificus]
MLDKKSTLNNIFCTIALVIASIGSAFASTQALVSEKQCDACHGANGVSGHTDIPTIAGIPEFNLSDQMLRYLEGRPANTVQHVSGDIRQSGDMATIVRSLTEDEIEQLAAYYADMEFVRAKQPFDQALANQGKAIHLKSCESCHADGGSDPLDEASILAGHPKGYLTSITKRLFVNHLNAISSRQTLSRQENG